MILFDDNFDNHGIAKKSFDVSILNNQVQGAGSLNVAKDEWTIF
jgi:hypothetical protein